MEQEYAIKPASCKKRNVFKMCRTALLLILIPATILLGARFGGKQYYFVSLLVILYTMLPVFVFYEKRRPEARELVLLSVLCAIAVASRAAFIFLPHFKPMAAIIIIIGVALGPESGFLAGALSAFVSNFIFGQGPWTPWQMFAFGIAGFLAGLLFQKKLISRKKLPLCIFGGLCTLLVIGPVLDISALVSLPTAINAQSAALIFLSGLPVNAVQSLATVLTLFLVSAPMFEKLDRIKMKYGMGE